MLTPGHLGVGVGGRAGMDPSTLFLHQERAE